MQMHINSLKPLHSEQEQMCQNTNLTKHAQRLLINKSLQEAQNTTETATLKSDAHSWDRSAFRCSGITHLHGFLYMHCFLKCSVFLLIEVFWTVVAHLLLSVIVLMCCIVKCDNLLSHCAFVWQFLQLHFHTSVNKKFPLV